jgi:hypothetical protein
MDGEREPEASRVPRAAEPDRIGHDELAARKAIVEGTARSTGEEFFQSLVRHLSRAIDARYAFVADVNTRVRTLAYWFRDRLQPNVEFDLAGIPLRKRQRNADGAPAPPWSNRQSFHDEGRNERPPGSAGAVQAGLDPASGDSQLPRDLLGVKFFDVPQQQGGPVGFGQPVPASPHRELPGQHH